MTRDVQQTVNRSRMNDFNALCNMSVMNSSKGNAMCTAYAQRMQRFKKKETLVFVRVVNFIYIYIYIHYLCKKFIDVHQILYARTCFVKITCFNRLFSK